MTTWETMTQDERVHYKRVDKRLHAEIAKYSVDIIMMVVWLVTVLTAAAQGVSGLTLGVVSMFSLAWFGFHVWMNRIIKRMRAAGA